MKLLKKHNIPFHPRQEPKHPEPISAANVTEIFSDCSDFVLREVYIGGNKHFAAAVCFLDGLTDGGDIASDILRPLTDPARFDGAASLRACMELIERGAVYSGSMTAADSADQLCECLVNGFCAIIFDSAHRAICFEVRSANARGIEQPSAEKSVKGAKDSFVEVLRTNTTLVRRKLREPSLKIRQTILGRKSATNAAVFYYDGVADPARVDELMRRLNDIDIQGVLTTASLEEYIVSSPRSPFPQLLHTERPDVFAQSLLAGRIGVMVDGMPMGFLMPATFFRLLRVPDDDAQHYIIATALTLLRYIALILAVALPAFMVAVEMYHQEMIPTKLLISMIQAKQQVPFGAAVEVLSMLVAFELLQEAGLRLPDSVGQTVSIIGALIVGQSAVEASVISPVAVIIVALSGICGYTIPSSDLSTAVRLCRFLMVLCAIAAGMFGVMAGAVMLIYHLASLESFGVDYLSPVSDRGLLCAVHALIRPPMRQRKLRDPALNTPDRRSRK